jgi:hypothetical protein
MPPPPAPTHAIGRWLLPVAVGALAVAAWGGFEIRDEVAEPPGARPIRLAPAPSELAAAIEYVEGFEAGQRRAAAEGRPMLVLFRASWCRWCAELARGPLVDRRLVGLSRQFVCVMVDADRHPDECRRFGVREFPTLLLATSAGVERRRWTGCPAADELVSGLSETVPTERWATADGSDTSATR